MGGCHNIDLELSSMEHNLGTSNKHTLKYHFISNDLRQFQNGIALMTFL